MLHHTPPLLPLPCNNSNVLAVSTPSHKATCRRLPSVLIDFIAITLCDLIPVKSSLAKRRTSSSSLSSTFSSSSVPSLPSIRGRPLPELVYFIQKITFTAEINVRTALVALIYLDRAKSHLPKNAVGNHGKYTHARPDLTVLTSPSLDRYKPSPALGISPDRIQIPPGHHMDQKHPDKPPFIRTLRWFILSGRNRSNGACLFETDPVSMLGGR